MLTSESEKPKQVEIPVNTANHKSTYIDTPDSSDGSIPPPPTKKYMAVDTPDSSDSYVPPPPPAVESETKDDGVTMKGENMDDTTQINMNEIEEEEEVVDDHEDNKKRQLELLKQTYVDVAKRKINRQKNIFTPIIDVQKIIVNANTIDKNIESRLAKKLKEKLEMKCNKHGLIKEDSINIMSVSSAVLFGSKAEFHITFQALACNPIEGMIVESTIINITKAGIRAELTNVKKSPLIIFIARDHHSNSYHFNKAKEGDVINVKIIGVRFELNDAFVSVIGEIYNI